MTGLHSEVGWMYECGCDDPEGIIEEELTLLPADVIRLAVHGFPGAIPGSV